MKKYLNSSIGRLRLLAFWEGLSLLVLVFVGMPLKYGLQSEGLVKTLGPIHGVLFVLFVINALYVAVAERWPFFWVTLQVLVASFIPFGTFYIDRKVLRPIHAKLLATAPGA